MIKVLIAQMLDGENDVAPETISRTVAGPISDARWQAESEGVPGHDRLTEASPDLVREFQRHRGPSLRIFGVTPRDRESVDLRMVGVVELT